MSQNRLVALLRTLAESQSDFIVVGGLAAVLRGAPVQTYHVDIVHARNDGNVERLLNVLGSLDAIFRIQPQRPLRPNASHLAGSGHLNLITREGPLDLLATIGNGLGFEDLLPESSEMNIGGGMKVRVLSLDAIIRLKEQLSGEKDIASLPVLRRTLEESKKKSAEK
jgi:hypothetical protein